MSATIRKVRYLNEALDQFKDTHYLIFTPVQRKNEYFVVLGCTVERVNKQFIQIFCQRLTRFYGKDQWEAVCQSDDEDIQHLPLIVRRVFWD